MNPIIRLLQTKFPEKTLEEIELIYYYQFQFVTEKIREGNEKDILLHRFGRFKFKQNRKETITKRYIEKEERRIENNETDGNHQDNSEL